MAEAFEKWAEREGYATGDRSKWDLDAVPKGGKLGEVTLSQAWKASAFDRWHMTWHGLERVTPHLVLQTISSDKPVETIVYINVGIPPKDPQRRQNWKALLDSLAAAIKVSETNGATSAKVTSAPTAAEILRKMEETYHLLTSFSAAGKMTSEIKTPDFLSGAPLPTTDLTFTIKLARPDLYRIEWGHEFSSVDRGAVWSSWDGHYVLTAGKVSKHASRQLALIIGSTLLQGNIVRTAPPLFFPDVLFGASWLAQLKNAATQPDERIGGEDCYVLSAEDPTGTTTVWITKRDFLLKQHRQTTGAGERNGTFVASALMSDDDLKRIEGSGKEATQQEINDMRKRFADVEKFAARTRVTFTQTYQNISINKPMAKEEFEYPVPKDAVAELPAQPKAKATPTK